MRSERVQHLAVGDVAGVQDDVGASQLATDAVGEPRRRARAEVGVGHEQHVDHGASLQR